MSDGYRPRFSPGVLEQGIYTWSSSNLNGLQGRAFGAASPALQRHVKWLGKLDQTHFRLLDSTISVTTDGYEGWQQQCTVGSFRVDGASIVYRKVAGADQDREKRTRWIVHALMGRSEDLDLARVNDDDEVWLSASDCPLDRLPALSPIKSDTLVPRDTRHVCAEIDPYARQLLRELQESPAELHLGRAQQVSPSRLTTALLTLVPTALWTSIELDWFVGETGPVARVTIRDCLGGLPPVDGRAELAGLADCEMHANVDRVWSKLPEKDKSWAHFGEAYRESESESERAVSLRTQPVRRTPAREDSATQTAAQQIQHTVQTLVDPEWAFDRPLTDAEIIRVVRALGTWRPGERSWLSTMRSDQLGALLRNATSDEGINATTTLLADTPVAAIARAWRITCLSALGLTLLGREDRFTLRGRWAVPKAIDIAQLRNVVHPLGRRGSAGVDQVAELIRGGFGAKSSARHALVAALLQAGFTPQRVFGTILLRADLSTSELLGFMRDNPRAAAVGLELPSAYVEAFVHGFARRRKPTLIALLPHILGEPHDA